MVRASVAVVVASACSAGCNDAVIVEVASDRPVPQAIDSFCIGLADSSPTGGLFGRTYRLEGAIASLPQTLRVEPGGAGDARVWVRGDRGGVAAARASAAIDFGSDITLALDRCVVGPAFAPKQYGDTLGPTNAKLAASAGPGGTLVVAIGGGQAAILDVRDSAVIANPAPPAPNGNIRAVVAADVDGDCADDVIIATDGAPPQIWLRARDTFVAGDTIGTAAMSAIAAGDVDRDGDLDVVLGSGSTLQLWRNDGGGTFTQDTTALAGGGHVSTTTAVALGDVDGDGNPDLVVGQASAPLAAWLGEPGGTGSFLFSTGIVPAVPLDVASLAFADADGDYDPDLAVAIHGAPMRLYIDRDGRLEDQSFVRLPQPPPEARAVALGGWDDGCEPDAVIAADAGADTLRGQPGGTYASDASAPPANDVILADIDDDGDLDAILATPEGVVWLAR